VNERAFELETYAVLARHVKDEADRLVGIAEAQLARIEQARGSASEVAIAHLVERELLDLQRQLSEAQWRLVHRRDQRYAACHRLLNEPPLLAQRSAESAAA
jgi:hypothetical protein